MSRFLIALDLLDQRGNIFLAQSNASETVKCNAANVASSEACRRRDGNAIWLAFVLGAESCNDLSKEDGFTGTCRSGEEDTLLVLDNKIENVLLLLTQEDLVELLLLLRLYRGLDIRIGCIVCLVRGLLVGLSELFLLLFDGAGCCVPWESCFL
jgi:hypothetical protein